MWFSSGIEIGSRMLRGAPALALAWIVGAGCLEAGSVRSVNLEDLTRNAAEVFSGRCIDVRVATDPALSREVSEITFEVERAVKGELGTTRTIRMAGANGIPGGWALAGLPQFQPGEEVVLFLYGESRLGLSSPVAFGQGKFSVLRDKQGRAFALNSSGNANLLRGLSSTAEAQVRSVAGPGADPASFDPTSLLDLTEALVEAGR